MATTTSELRDPDAARRFLLQGLWMQRVRRPAVETVQRVLEWALEIASGGGPLPPLGFVADVGHLALSGAGVGCPEFSFPLGPQDGRQASRGKLNSGHPTPSNDVDGWAPADVRAYEDYVLGKLYADASFERAADAVAHYPTDRDRSRGLAFLMQQMERRAEFGGVLLSPGIVKALLRRPAEELHAEGWESLRGGVDPLLRELHAGLVAAMRNVGHVLGGEDVFELEHKTALAEFGQRVALRQVLQAASRFEDAVPRQPPRTSARREQVPTHMQDEDLYPVGGFTSLSNRGTIESLLHSQLAYMETAAAERPDLFDVKFLRDELLYYSRDENQFFRRRRTIVFALFPELAECRVKDAELPFQRIVLLLGLLTAVIRRLTEWLRDDALVFELLLLEEAGVPLLADERELLEMIFRDQIANGTVVVESVKPASVAARCRERARRSLCHCTMISVRDRAFPSDETVVLRLQLNAPAPRLLGDEIGNAVDHDPPTAWPAWQNLVEGFLRCFV
jgi:vWA domain found in the FtsH ternary systems/N-terminal helical region fused to the FtsH ternary system vWA domain